jgi:hypothetical protein
MRPETRNTVFGCVRRLSNEWHPQGGFGTGRATEAFNGGLTSFKRAFFLMVVSSKTRFSNFRKAWAMLVDGAASRECRTGGLVIQPSMSAICQPMPGQPRRQNPDWNVGQMGQIGRMKEVR